MRLVIDPQHVSECTMVVGKVELPLTREQVVAMLFGDEWEIVRKRDGARLGADEPVRRGRPPKATPARRGRPPKALAAAKPKTSRQVAKPGEPPFYKQVLSVLAGHSKPLLGEEIKALVEKRYPGSTTSRHPSSVAAALITLRQQRSVKRTGESGTFRYVASAGKPAAKASAGKDAVARRARDAARKKIARKAKRGVKMLNAKAPRTAHMNGTQTPLFSPSAVEGNA